MLAGPLQPTGQTLAGPLQPAFAFRITKNGKLPTEREAFGQLTGTPRHAWPRVRLKP
jgi:hypothetical protein